MIPTYNRSDYLKEALESVLEQDLGIEQMQIEVIDNCSVESDVTAIVDKVGQGRISVYQQPYHVGMNDNWNTCINRARGHYVHILHDDDLVRPGFYKHLQVAFEQEVNVGAAFCRSIFIDEDSHWQSIPTLEEKTAGILPNYLERIAVVSFIYTPAIAVRRVAYEKLGGFCAEAGSATDWEMWKRIAANYSIWYEPQPLVCYRIHTVSESSKLFKTGKNIADIRCAIQISQAYLPKSIAVDLTNKARNFYARTAINAARQRLSVGEVDTAMAQIREALKFSMNLKIIVLVIDTFVWTITDRTSRIFRKTVKNSLDLLTRDPLIR